MSAIFRRAAALCLCVMLLAASAAADTSGMKAYSYTLHFTMHPEAYPAADQPIIQGIADMLNITGISGVYTTDGHAFDNNMTLQLGSRPETSTSIRVYGKPAHWWVESSLLGGEMLMVNNAALLEFGMKAYAHLNMPLQYPLLLINPYVHTSAFEWIMPEWEAVFGGSGSRTVSIDDLYSLASFIADNGESDRAFLYWVYALTREIGIDYDVLDALYFLPDWVDYSFDPEGIVITVDGSTETWMNGGELLFTRTTDDAAESWQLVLPMSDSGHVAEVSFSRTATDFSFTLSVTAYDPGDTLLIEASGTHPAAGLLTPGATTLHFDMTGSMLLAPVSLRLSAIADASSFIITQTDAQTGKPMLTVTGTHTEIEPAKVGIWTERSVSDGVNILSVSDATLAEFLGSIIGPAFEGAWPLLVHLPASTFASAYDLLNQYGVLEMVVYSLQ